MATVIKAANARIDSLLKTLVADGMPREAVVIYRGRNVVAKLPAEGINIKSYKVPDSIKGFIYGHLRMPKAQRAYENGQKLKSLGISTPEPLGMALNLEGGQLRQSFYVSRQLEGWSEMRGAEKLDFFAELSAALAGFILDMHRKGVFMKDLTPGNVLFRRHGDEFEFTLVDINRMEFDITDRKTLLSNLGLIFDTEDGIARLARDYARLSGDDADALEEQCRRQYRARWRYLGRKKRLKKLLGIKPH